MEVDNRPIVQYNALVQTVDGLNTFIINGNTVKESSCSVSSLQLMVDEVSFI